MIVRSTVFTIVALIVPAASAAVLLPLQGYYRSGRYFPISIEMAGVAKVTVSADGAVPTQITRQSAGSVISPILSLGPAVGTIHVGDLTGSQKPQPLDVRDSLVGVAGGAGAEAVARAMFPGSKIVIVHLEPADPLPGPPIAWQSLDGIVLAERWPGGLKLANLPAYLAGGMTVGVAASEAPDQLLPWRPISGGWVLRPNLAGPLGCDGNEDAYTPSMTWHPDLQSSLRLRIVGWAGVIILLLLLTSFTPKRIRYPAAAIIAICGITLPMRPAGSFQAIGEIEVARSGWEQRDRWTYFAGPIETQRSVTLDEESWPVFTDPSQATRLKLELHDDGERQSFEFTLPMNNRLAFLQRQIRPAAGDGGGTVDRISPMSRLARLLYRDAGEPQSATKIQVPTDDPHPTWPTVTCGTK